MSFSDNDCVTLWLEQVKEGDQEAVRLLLGRYFERLVQLAGARLRGRPDLAGYDEDVALSAFASLCRGAQRGRFPELSDRDGLWRLLAVLTVRKAIDLQRRQRPEQQVDVDDLGDFLAREPTPELAAEMTEEFRRLIDRLPEPELRAIALWKVEGYSNEEIAQRLGCVVRSVERKLQRIRLEWEEEQPA